MVRGRIESKADEVHLGYIFNDQPKEKGGYRYTVNSAVLDFVPYDKLPPQQQQKYFPEMKKK